MQHTVLRCTQATNCYATFQLLLKSTKSQFLLVCGTELRLQNPFKYSHATCNSQITKKANFLHFLLAFRKSFVNRHL